MFEIQHHDEREYTRWFDRLAKVDQRRVIRARALLRTTGPALTMPHVRRLGRKLSELRIDKHRIYFTTQGNTVTILACGDKDTQ